MFPSVSCLNSHVKEIQDSIESMKLFSVPFAYYLITQRFSSDHLPSQTRALHLSREPLSRPPSGASSPPALMMATHLRALALIAANILGMKSGFTKNILNTRYFTRVQYIHFYFLVKPTTNISENRNPFFILVIVILVTLH